MYTKTQTRDFNALAGQAPARDSASPVPIPWGVSQPLEQRPNNKVLPPPPADANDGRAGLLGNALPKSRQNSHSGVYHRKLVKKNQNRLVKPSRLRFWQRAPSKQLRLKVSAPSNPIHVDGWSAPPNDLSASFQPRSRHAANSNIQLSITPETALRSHPVPEVPLISISLSSEPGNEIDFQARPLSSGNLSSEHAWKISYEKEAKVRKNLEGSLAQQSQRNSKLQEEINHLKRQVDLAKSTVQAQEIEAEVARTELLRARERAMIDENEATFQRKSREHVERELQRLQSRYEGLSEAQETIAAQRTIWSSESARQVLWQHRHPFSAETPHGALSPVKEEPADQVDEPAAPQTEASSEYPISEMEALRAGFTDIITAQEREALEEQLVFRAYPDPPTFAATDDIPIASPVAPPEQPLLSPRVSRSPTPPATEVNPIQEPITHLEQAPVLLESLEFSRPTTPISPNDPFATRTAFQFGPRRIKRVPRVFRISLTSQAGENVSHVQQSTSGILPTLDGWWWNSIPDVQLEDWNIGE
ncbi:hypothetical protein PVAG01_00833 [Phlyctema vagabunda]|uniref:Uncharacterized protein n=1 Tax=Phlyctema vagabunda TaxID=108571 RepID=A0ABR4PVD3_9HELO